MSSGILYKNFLGFVRTVADRVRIRVYERIMYERLSTFDGINGSPFTLRNKKRSLKVHTQPTLEMVEEERGRVDSVLKTSVLVLGSTNCS